MEHFTAFLKTIGKWLATEGLKVALALLIFFLFCKIINMLFRKIERHEGKRKIDITAKRLFIVWAKRVLKFLAFISMLTFLGMETSGIAAAITSVGLTLGLALQGSLSNFAGGIVIVTLHPFKVGDYIECGAVSGTVDKIELFHTFLITPDNRQIIIPNAQTANAVIVNYSAMSTRRDELTFCISYDADFAKAKQLIQTEMNNCPTILKDPATFVNISKHGANCIEIVTRFWSESDNFWTSHWFMLESVKTAFDNNGIEIPYPQLDVHLKDSTANMPKNAPLSGRDDDADNNDMADAPLLAEIENIADKIGD